MKSKININREHSNGVLEVGVLIDAGSPINAGSLLYAGVSRSRAFIRSFMIAYC